MEEQDNKDLQTKKQILLEALENNDFLADDEIWKIVNDTPVTILDALISDGVEIKEWEYEEGGYFYSVEK